MISLIELLDPDSEVSAVAFQLTGAKGWDDIGVRLKDGSTRLIQAKHTRADDRITFGDVVYPTIKSDGEEKASLLKSLSIAWKSTKTDYPKIECCRFR